MSLVILMLTSLKILILFPSRDRGFPSPRNNGFRLNIIFEACNKKKLKEGKVGF